MSDYRRFRVPGGTYFFSAVIERRQRLLTTDLGRASLREAIRITRSRRPFAMIAIVLLPDHLHCVWQLPKDDDDFSTRWRHLKSEFTRRYLSHASHPEEFNRSKQRKQERGIWQRRFYERACRDDEDVKRCVDYIHWNPVKHGIVDQVKDYPWSSFFRYVRLGEYALEWGAGESCQRLEIGE